MGKRNSSVMTPSQARLAVRSLAYRRRLMEGVSEIEAQLKAYLKAVRVGIAKEAIIKIRR